MADPVNKSDVQPTCWIVTDGKSGMENQCLGLAWALGLKPEIKRVKLRGPWRRLSPYLRACLGFAFSREGDPIEPPWPDLIIATGRLSVPAALYIKRRSPSTFVVQLQDPVISPSHFDLVVVPKHDNLQGPNVMSTRGSLSSSCVTPELLKNEAEKLAPKIAQLRAPRIAVLVGGSNASYRLTPRAVKRFGDQLAEAATTTGGCLLITPSRRTGDENLAVLREALRGVPSYIWDGQGDNPYYGMLGLADYIVVTCDSVNMVSEACATGKPVYVIHMRGGSPKFKQFHESLSSGGFARPFEGRLERWSYEPLNDAKEVAARITAEMKKRKTIRAA